MKADVVVVGAGPAGSATALRLARAGWDVLLLERERVPRYKVCGGGVTRKALAELPFDPADVLECAPTRARVSVRSGTPIEIDVGEVAAWTVMRDRFDARIAEEAVRAGARLMDGCRAIGIRDGLLQTDHGAIHARAIVGADGAPSRIAAALGLRPAARQTPAIEAEVEVDPRRVAEWRNVVLFDFDATPMGYGWIFPKADHLSIGLCSLHDKLPGLRERTRAYIAQVLSGEPFQVRSLVGHVLPVGGPVGPVHQGNVLLVGDAAGLVDPFLGEGIAYALRSARLAAEAIDRFLRGEAADLTPYSVAIAELHEREFRWADRLGRIVFRHTTLADRLAFRNRYLAALFVGVLTGDRSYRRFVLDCWRAPHRLLAGYFSLGIASNR
ncbi:MAG: geranylgeranyl reductase [Dehalococcoidia bacterium]|nr:MAG: geranylgeranyl reductase [Dehalococcoidia bacterium]